MPTDSRRRPKPIPQCCTDACDPGIILYNRLVDLAHKVHTIDGLLCQRRFWVDWALEMDVASKVSTLSTRDSVQFLDLGNALTYTQERVGKDVENTHPHKTGEQCVNWKTHNQAWDTVQAPVYRVYLIRCSNGSLYCGQTANLAARLKLHQTGRGARAVRLAGFQQLAQSWLVANRRDALRLEYAIKALPKAQKEALVLAPERLNILAVQKGIALPEMLSVSESLESE
jgi:putative endonuclease